MSRIIILTGIVCLLTQCVAFSDPGVQKKCINLVCEVIFKQITTK